LPFSVEEASDSQSETEDSTASPGRHVADESSVVKTAGDDRSNDSTDEDSETSKQNIVHAGDGDKADGLFTSSILKMD